MSAILREWSHWVYLNTPYYTLEGPQMRTIIIHRLCEFPHHHRQDVWCSRRASQTTRLRFKRSLFLPLRAVYSYKYENSNTLFRRLAFSERAPDSSYIRDILPESICAWAERGLYLSVLSACSQLTGPTRKWCSKRRPWIETLTLRVARSWVSLELAHSAHRALRADGRCRRRRTRRHQARAPKTWCCRSPASPPPPADPTKAKTSANRLWIFFYLEPRIETHLFRQPTAVFAFHSVPQTNEM